MAPLRRLALLLAVSLLAVGDPAAAKDLRVGTCRRDMTPVSPGLAAAYEARFGVPAVVNHSDPVWMAGFGNGRSALDYHDRLWARGVVLDGKGARIAIVTLDVVGYFANEIATIRAMVSPASNVDYVVITSTHQHEGPDTLGLWGPDELTTGIDYGYLDFVNAAAADCVDEAAASLERARVRFATTTSEGLSMGLDPEDDGLGVADGKVLAGDASLAPATGGRIVDPTLAVMQFTTRGAPRTVIATLVNFGSHPESLGSANRLITADFPHAARERIEAAYGGLAIWVSGDLGVLQGPLDIDVLDPGTGAPAPRRSFRFAEVHGTQLAERVITALGTAGHGDVAPKLRFASVNPVAIPLENPFFRLFAAVGVLNVRRPLFTEGVPDPSVGFPFPPPFDPIPQAFGEDIHTEVGALRIGRASVALVPTELDPQIGDSYRARMAGADHTFIFGLANDHIGYQVPFAKWDPSCHLCGPFVIAGIEEFCPVQPIDCNTVFANNVGQGVDPAVTGALEPLLDALR
ncbi:MAG: neutral/alkaline non-lysosomal ceramidase N-terminal domain-containing protein [Candidatus Binatia bacterium]